MSPSLLIWTQVRLTHAEKQKQACNSARSASELSRERIQLLFVCMNNIAQYLTTLKFRVWSAVTVIVSRQLQLLFCLRLQLLFVVTSMCSLSVSAEIWRNHLDTTLYCKGCFSVS